jgi:hypothetical protein
MTLNSLMNGVRGMFTYSNNTREASPGCLSPMRLGLSAFRRERLE